MKLIFNNQISIFEDIFYKYLTPKQCTKLYTSNIILYNIYNTNNKFENNYFTPRNYDELMDSVNEWCINREEAIIKYGNIEYWNTKYIISMEHLFRNKIYFNDNISDWNTSNVKNMNYMFYNAIIFNQNLNNWNISNIKSIYYIFIAANSFNKLNCIDWNLTHIYKIHSNGCKTNLMMFNSFE